MKDVKNTTKSLFVRIDSDLYEQLQSLKLLTSSNLQVLVQDMLREAVKNKFISLNKQKKDAATMTEKLNVMVEKMEELRGW